MNNSAPIREPAGDKWSPSWVNWFSQVFSCLPWKKGFNITATIDFLSVPAQSERTSAVTVTGARSGDAVTVTPLANTAGIIYAGAVTANDTVTVYAKNFTAGAIDPASTTFRVIVFQN